MDLGSLGRALAHRNFRLFFFGQGVSLIGTWMQQVALSWLVFELTGSSFWLGFVSFSGQAPALALAPFAGVFVDRWNRHRLLLATQTVMMLQAFAMAALALTGTADVTNLVTLSVVLGVVNVFDMTARQAFYTEMLDRREDLANAIALNSTMVNGSRLVGPALAGLLLAETSAGVCFLVNGLSYLAVLAALLAMRLNPRPRERSRGRVLAGLREGIGYAFGFAPIRAILLLLSLVSLMGMSYSVLLPIFARDVLGGGAYTYGLLGAASGVGALAGALRLAARHSVLGLGRWIAVMPALFGAALIAFSFSRTLWLSLPLLAVAGFAMMVHMAASNTVLQTIVDEDKRGRVMSLYTMAFLGTAPLGSLLAGWLADVNLIGAQNTVRLGGACCAVGSLLFAAQLPRLREKVRPIYVRMGILPEVAAGIGAASEMAVPPEEQ
ncbi:MAG TPA: MFS transporter [Gemmataceae bacterium]|nr:MFS transporter [Gemmataceae bacterium]